MIISKTPFRMSFFGGGTDFPQWYNNHGGCVLTTTINKYCYINLRKLPPFFNYQFRLRYFKTEEKKNIKSISHKSFKEILSYYKFDKEFIEIVYHADLPALSGLGSSSSSTVGMINAVNAYKNVRLSKKKLYYEAIKIEQQILKENVGSQDQANAAYGGFNFFEFKKNNIKVNTINNKKNINKLENSILLIFTGMQRHSQNIEKDKINSINKKKSIHNLLTMKDITYEAKKLIMSKNFNQKYFGELLNEQWKLKKNLSSRVTNNKIDEIYNGALDMGAFGGKLLGAGAGGFLMLVCDHATKKKIKKKYFKLMNIPIKFENEGSKILYLNKSSFS